MERNFDHIIFVPARGYGKSMMGEVIKMVDYLESLDSPGRYKEVVRIIREEPCDTPLRIKLRVIFKLYYFAVSKDIWQQTKGSTEKLIDMIIENRHKDINII